MLIPISSSFTFPSYPTCPATCPYFVPYVEKAAGQYAVSPTNQAFIQEYRAALQAFIRKHRDDADPDLIEDYEQELNKLSQN